MDWERARISLEVLSIRGRGWARFIARLVGLCLVLWAGVNMLALPVLELDPYAPYRVFGPIFTSPEQLSAVYLGDVLVIGAGGLLAWLS